MDDILFEKNTPQTITIGSNIKKWRAIKEVKQEHLAKKMNLTPAQLSKIENGKVTIKISRVVEVAKYLNVEVEELLNSNFNFTNITNSPHSNNSNGSGNITMNNDKQLYEKLIDTLNKVLGKLK
jgi:transcriptional regulator with XRE-family HTH domain